MAELVEKRDPLATIVEIAVVPADWIHAGIPGFPGVRVRVRPQNGAGARTKDRALVEDECDPVEIHSTQVYGRAGDVLQLEKFVHGTADGIVHNFGDTNRRAQGC